MTIEQFQKAGEVKTKVASLNDENKRIRQHIKTIISVSGNEDHFSAYVYAWDQRTDISPVFIQEALQNQLATNNAKIEALEKEFADL
jgi:uncharacterized protein involved in exopolysaccharide biosynthesis